MSIVKHLVRRPVRAFLASGLLALLIVLASSAATPARADEIHPQLRGFLRTGKYAIQVGRSIVEDAEIYHSQEAAAFLLIKTGYASPLVVRPANASVESVKPEDIVALDDGSRALKADAETETIGTYRRTGRQTVIQVPGFTAAMVANPPLLGWYGSSRLLSHTPEYGQDAEAYQADAATIKKLARRETPIQVYVYFGSWCHTCSRFLGKIIRVEQELMGGGVTFRYYGLPKPPEMNRDPEVRQRGIRKLPTGLIYSGNTYLGSIISVDWNHPEEALERVISAALGD